MKKKKKLISFIILAVFLFNTISIFTNKIRADAVNTGIQPYDDVREKDLSAMDFRGKSDLLFTLTFNTNTKWPGKDKMPEDFDPAKILEYGKYAGLGIERMHNLGYTGAGVNIAYIDQPLLEGHEAYNNVKLKYYKIRPEEDGMETSMHGPSVLSLLAGNKTGIAPDANVYFFGHPAWLRDQRTHAEALYKLIEVNKGLSQDKKIRVVGFSDGPDPTEKNIEDYKAAIAEAEKNNIMVIDVTTFDYSPVFIKPFKDKDNYNNYQVAQWKSNYESGKSGEFYVPTSARTTADGTGNDKTKYDYWTNGGLSWAVPYVVGTIALGLQVDPNLSKENAMKYLYESGHDFNGGKIINPEGFINMVTQNCANPQDVSKNRDYRYLLYNKNKVSNEDLQSINDYAGKFNDGTLNILKDVSKYTSATDIYTMLKTDSQSRTGSLKGIQIFGTSDDVPAFNVNYKIQMQSGVDQGGNFNSDFFYSSLKSDSDALKNDFSIYKAFNNKLNVSFMPEWPVTRLPLTKGEIAPYMGRSQQYASQASSMDFGNFVNFSNPIFAGKVHSDDMGYFIRERLDKEFNILSSNEYKLYGNKQGVYPVQTDVLGDYTKDNIAKENQNGIKEFIINDHGQWNNIDQCIYTTEDAKSEKRISFLNMDTINSVLSNNYYDLDLWTCSNAYNLNGNNLVHEAMNNGKCISAMAASSVISNNGVHNDASLENLKKNNFYYFYLNYFYNRAKGEGRTNSFSEAQKAYAEEILKNTNMLYDGNYQYNLLNLLSYHYLGLAEYWNYKGKSNFNPNIFNNTTDTDNSGNTSSFDGNIKFESNYSNNGFKVNSLKAKIAGNKVIFTMDYYSPQNYDCSFFNNPSGDIIKKVGYNQIKSGNNILELSLSSDELKKIVGLNEITMRFGFNNNDTNFIFFNPSQLKPLLVTGWIQTNGRWKYIQNDGTPAIGWIKVDGSWYFMDKGGIMQTGWLSSGGKWYYLNDSGDMATGWKFVNGIWYYLQSGGAMKTGWLQLGSSWYYLNSNGSMAKDTTIGGYKLNGDGVLN